MTKAELKDRLIATIAATEDQRLLEDVYRMIKLESESPVIYELSDPERSAGKEGIAQLDTSHFLSDEDLNAQINESLTLH